MPRMEVLMFSGPIYALRQQTNFIMPIAAAGIRAPYFSGDLEHLPCRQDFIAFGDHQAYNGAALNFRLLPDKQDKLAGLENTPPFSVKGQKFALIDPKGLRPLPSTITKTQRPEKKTDLARIGIFTSSSGLNLNQIPHIPSIFNLKAPIWTPRQ